MKQMIRTWKRNPLLTVAAIVSLALGIGANSAIFSLLDQVVFRMLPVRDPQQLVLIHNTGPQQGWTTSDTDETCFSYLAYKDLRDRTSAFQGLLARAQATVSLRHSGTAERASAEIVSGNFFELLGVQPVMGRLLTAEDDLHVGGHPVIVLSHGYWQRRFGANPAILNQPVQINGQAMTVIGVAPARFRGVISNNAPDLYAPIAMKRQITPTWDGLKEREVMWLNVIGRVKPELSVAQAQASTQSVFEGMLQETLARSKNPSQRFRERLLASKIELRTGSQGIHELRKGYEKPLVALMAMAGFVLLIACANVANLLLAKAAARSKEIALRLAIGASRTDILKQVLSESIALAVAGGLLGLLLCLWTTDALIKLSDNENVLSSAVDWRILLFTMGISIGTGVLFGMLPAWRASDTDLNTVLKDQAANVRTGSAQASFRKVLVTAQISLSLVLLVGAGLFATNLYRLLTISPGFRTDQLIQFRLAPKLAGYDQPRTVQYFRELQARLSQVAGVDSVSAAEIEVLSGNGRSANITVEGYRAKEDEDMTTHMNPVGPNYFRTLGIPLIAGREFSTKDDISAPKTVVVNESFVRRFFPDQNALGKRMTFGSGDVKLDREIVGIVKDSKHDSLTNAIPKLVYFPYEQDKDLPSLSFYLRTSRSIDSIGNDVRALVRNLDANVPLYDMKSMRRQLEQSVNTQRLLAFLSNAFGLLATLLASIGLYGVISHMVQIRTPELGVRIALGASRMDVLKLVLAEVGSLTIIGIGIGLVAAVAMGRLLQTQLYQMQANDPLVMAGATAALVLTALVAGWLPARRASRIDPMHALRHE